MIGSHKNKFIFFHLYKVAGTSMRGVLNNYQEFDRTPPHIKPSEYINKGAISNKTVLRNMCDAFMPYYFLNFLCYKYVLFQQM